MARLQDQLQVRLLPQGDARGLRGVAKVQQFFERLEIGSDLGDLRASMAVHAHQLQTWNGCRQSISFERRLSGNTEFIILQTSGDCGMRALPRGDDAATPARDAQWPLLPRSRCSSSTETAYGHICCDYVLTVPDSTKGYSKSDEYFGYHSYGGAAATDRANTCRDDLRKVVVR